MARYPGAWNAKRKLEVDLAAVAGRTLGKLREKIQALGEMGDCFGVGRPIVGAQTGLVPVRHRFIQQAPSVAWWASSSGSVSARSGKRSRRILATREWSCWRRLFRSDW